MLNKRIANIEIPNNLKHLSISDEGYPVPWFVSWINDKPDFRAFDVNKFQTAIRFHRCWICGKPMGKYRTFVIGPMCMINRINSEPPSHHSCAEYAAIACPFLTQPRMRRNEKDLPAMRMAAGIQIARNPGVCVLWTTFSYELMQTNTGILFQLGKPEKIEFYANARHATRAEVLESINTGLPLLRAMDKGDQIAQAMIDQRYQEAMKLLPAEV